MIYFTSKPYKRIYYAPLWSDACLTCGLFAVIIVILPFFLAYSTNNFWLPSQTYYEKPNVVLEKHILMFVRQGDTTYKFSDQIPYFYSENKLRSPSIKFESEINNFDGTPDSHHVKISFIPETSSPPTNIHLFLFLDYQLQKTVKLEMQSLVHVVFESSVGIGSATAFGDVTFKQYEALSSSTIPRTVYNTSVFNETFDNSYNILQLLNEYNSRNETTFFKYQSFINPSPSTPRVDLSIDLLVPKHQKILYVPDFLEYVKFAWVQYFSLLVPTYFLFTWLLIFVFRYKLMHVFTVEDHEMAADAKLKQ